MSELNVQVPSKSVAEKGVPKKRKNTKVNYVGYRPPPHHISVTDSIDESKPNGDVVPVPSGASKQVTAAASAAAATVVTSKPLVRLFSEKNELILREALQFSGLDSGDQLPADTNNDYYSTLNELGTFLSGNGSEYYFMVCWSSSGYVFVGFKPPSLRFCFGRAGAVMVDMLVVGVVSKIAAKFPEYDQILPALITIARSYHPVCLPFGLCLVGLSSAAVNTTRQSPDSSSTATALVPSGISSAGSLGGILAPALRTLTAAPLCLLGQLLKEMVNFSRGRNFRELFDFMRQIISRVPDRALIYYQPLVDMESQCVQRTLCDLANLTSRPLPKWAEQIVLIFSENRPSYQVLINGLNTHQCPQVYSECDSEQFLARGNVSESISSTIAPVQAAFAYLANVTVTTLSSLAVDDAPRPVVANANRPDSNLSELDPLNESEEDEPNFRQPNRFPSRGLLFIAILTMSLHGVDGSNGTTPTGSESTWNDWIELAIVMFCVILLICSTALTMHFRRHGCCLCWLSFMTCLRDLWTPPNVVEAPPTIPPLNDNIVGRNDQLVPEEGGDKPENVASSSTPTSSSTTPPSSPTRPRVRPKSLPPSMPSDEERRRRSLTRLGVTDRRRPLLDFTDKAEVSDRSKIKPVHARWDNKDSKKEDPEEK